MRVDGDVDTIPYDDGVAYAGVFGHRHGDYDEDYADLLVAARNTAMVQYDGVDGGVATC